MKSKSIKSIKSNQIKSSNQIQSSQSNQARITSLYSSFELHQLRNRVNLTRKVRNDEMHNIQNYSTAIKSLSQPAKANEPHPTASAFPAAGHHTYTNLTLGSLVPPRPGTWGQLAGSDTWRKVRAILVKKCGKEIRHIYISVLYMLCSFL